MLSAILNRWLPRSNFIYSNNTLSTAGCCKSELRYLNHWYRLHCLGLVKSILGHSFGRSWYMRLFHTPRTSFLSTTRLWKHNSCSVLFLFQERTWKRPLEPFWIPLCVSVHKSTTWNQNIDEKFQWLLLADRSARILLLLLLLLLYLLAVGDVREYCVLSAVTHKGLKRVTLICLLCPMLVIIHFRKYHIWNEKKR